MFPKHSQQGLNLPQRGRCFGLVLGLSVQVLYVSVYLHGTRPVMMGTSTLLSHKYKCLGYKLTNNIFSEKNNVESYH